MWRRNLTFAVFCLVAVVAVLAYVVPRQKFAGQRSLGERYVAQQHGVRQTATPADIRDVVEKLDAEFAADWQRHDLRPAPSADALTVARRLSLALTGTIPALEEIKQIESLPPEMAGDVWLDYLLNDRRYGDHVAERFARALVGVEEGPFLIFRRRRFVSWLSDELMQGTPYDRLVRDIVTSSGLWTDSPAVNFLTVTSSEELEGRPDPIRLAGRTTRAFLGVRLDCMQCHDDNLEGEWLQSDFHELAAFFNEPTPSIVGMVDKPRDYEYQYLYADDNETVSPQVPFNEELFDPQGATRQRLARWITHPENRPFARTAVNRAWAVMFGRPLVEPIDSIPLQGPFPPALELLADDFVYHNYDLRRLWRVIAAARVFRADSRADHQLTEAHDKYWAAFPKTRLRPEQIAGALLQSARLATVDGGSHVLVRLARYGETNDFVRDYGDSGEDEFVAHGGTIPQRLVMMNGNLITERIKQDLIINAATRIAALAADDTTALRAAYLTVLTRKPTAAEYEHFREQWSQRGLNRQQQVADLCWTLLNSSEFSWNH